ncbi:hypothetical protein A6770_33750 [Nostoc minutum NIES-26]|uniref:non-specific serine/threonine protein kinase n=1 Tax=Nostoc minutum NIES-26 TaxID=1844469 RepID=A0A367Q2T3_9NOSO|nr:hypothetical protein A6770_33750 [Nostoc minutum NIES-26]
MKVYCTNPNCPDRVNDASDDLLTNFNRERQQFCKSCGMRLILEKHYLPLEILGCGGFGITFRARDFHLERDCAIKILHPQRQLNSSQLQSIITSFRRGAKTLSELKHEQIPSLYDFFNLPEPNGQEQIFYLVQEFIPGETLDQELARNRQLSESAVTDAMKSLLEVIRYTHNQKVLHRDIKPSNIIRHKLNRKLYLIDFDTSIRRELEPGIPIDQSLAIGSLGYAPLEQLAGRKIDTSADLYALAATCIHLLTNRHPEEIRLTSSTRLLNGAWKKYTTSYVSPNLESVLNRMLLVEPVDRYQSAEQVLAALNNNQILTLNNNQLVTNPGVAVKSPKPNRHQKSFNKLKEISRNLRPVRLVFLSFLVLLVLAIAVILNFIINPPLAKYFSRGEEALIAEAQAVSTIPECRTAYDLKKQGMEAFANSNSPADFKIAEDAFFEAIQEFQKAALKTSSTNNQCEVDPETWIYYYNSKAAQIPSAHNLPTVAVVIPNLEKDRGNALQVLRGIAQLQSEQESAPILQILLAKYDSKQKEVEYISKQNIPGELKYFSNSKILGVVGRYTSNNIWQAGDVFGANQLVLISPTSTAIRQSLLDSGQQQPLNKYVFRIASNDSIAAEDLANYMQKNHQGKKVLIIFDSQDIYSESLKNKFVDNLKRLGAKEQNIIGCNLTKSTNNPQLCIDKVKQEKVEILMLAPSPNTLEKVLNIAKETKSKKQNLQLLGGDVLYDLQTLDLGDAAGGMVVAVSSHASLANSNFMDTAKKLWLTKDLSWRTLTSYDAGKAFVKTLIDLRSQRNNNPTSQQVYEKLKAPNFLVPGATANIEFNNEHDRKQLTGVGVLVQATYNPQSDKYYFTLLRPIPNREEQNNP